jgi:hypothetical protein
MNVEESGTSKNKEFESLFESVTAKLKQTELNLLNGDYAIKEFCSELKRQVQLAKELKMKKLDDMSDQMMTKIESFEHEKLNVFLEAQNDNFKTKLDEMKQFLSEYNQKLENSKIVNNIHAVLGLQAQIETLNENFYSLLFDGEYLQFNPKESPSSFGEILIKKSDEMDLKESKNEMEVSDYVFEMKNSDRMDTLRDLRSNFDEDEIDPDYEDYIETSYVHFNDNKSVVFLYLNGSSMYGENDEINCFFFNETNTLIKKKKLDITYSEIISIKSNGENVVISFKAGNSSYDASYNIIAFNKDLEQRSRPIGSSDNEKFFAIEVNNSFIFTSLMDYTVLVFDWSLNFMFKFGQESDPEKPFYFPNPITSIKQKNGFYHILEHQDQKNSFLRIIDQKTGKILDTFSIEFEIESLLHIDSNNRLIFTKGESLIFLSVEGNFLKEIKLITNEWINWPNWSIDVQGMLHGHFYKKNFENEENDQDVENYSEYGGNVRKILMKSFKLPFH